MRAYRPDDSTLLYYELHVAEYVGATEPTGLGLSDARLLCPLTIWVVQQESEKKRGRVVWLTAATGDARAALCACPVTSHKHNFGVS